MRRRTKNLKSISTSKFNVEDVDSILKLPERYILFSGNVDEIQQRLPAMELKLLNRKIKILHPIKAYRFTVSDNHYAKGKHTIVTSRHPYTQIAIQVEECK